MNFIIWLVVGGLIGWLASLLMKTDSQQGVMLNVVVGIVGAMLGGWFISPLVGVSTINQDNFSMPSLIWLNPLSGPLSTICTAAFPVPLMFGKKRSSYSSG